MKKLFAISLIILLLAACTSKQEPASDELKPDEAKVEISGKLAITDPWVRVGGRGMNTALFFDVLNGTEFNDTLLSAESDVAELVEVHETYMSGNDMMGMRQVEFVKIPAGSKVSFKPRDLHVMLIKLVEDIKINDTVNVKLNFKESGQVSITAFAKEMNVKRMNH
ncbi:MAG: copper chaperone PCu(A)C [Melioribacteraceae bacterium]|nr:copper chaperone PCu(A)C [Melioribacteraceae bacterium]